MTEIDYVVKVHKYKNMILRLAVTYTKNQADAEDITQEVFIKLLKRNASFVSEEAEKAWLIRVTINASKDLLRTAWFKRTVPLDETIPFKEKEHSELFEALSSINLKYRTVIYLYYYEDYSIREICELLKIKESAAQMRLVRARRKLQEVLEKEYAIKKEGLYEARI